MSQTLTENAPDSGYTTSEEQFVDTQTMTIHDTVIHKEPYEPYTVIASELSLSDVELFSLQESELEEWTSAYDYNTRLKVRLAQKRNQQCVNELARLKEAYLVKTGEIEDKKNATKTPGALSSALSSEERLKFVARRAVLDKGRGGVGRSRPEIRWASIGELWGDSTSWGEEEDWGFVECEVEVTWEEMVLRESGKLQNWCRKKSGLRKSWTVTEPLEKEAGEETLDLDR